MSTQYFANSINVSGKLMDLSTPVVMGILNVTPDSFFTSISPSASFASKSVVSHVKSMLKEGASIIDIGGCSTRPGGAVVDSDKEWERLSLALKAVRDTFADAVVSVDTFRPEIAERSIKEFGVDIINDVSGGCEEMYKVVAANGVPYVLTFNEAQTEETACLNVCQRAIRFLAERVQALRNLGQKDIIIDPGFGFNKSTDESFQLLGMMEYLNVLHLPVLAGLSHKSMIYQQLGTTSQEALNGTTSLNTVALMRGANILRVHDVKEAMECITLTNKIKQLSVES